MSCPVPSQTHRQRELHTKRGAPHLLKSAQLTAEEWNELDRQRMKGVDKQTGGQERKTSESGANKKVFKI